MFRSLIILLLGCTLTASPTRAQEEVDLTPIKDNTLYEDESGELSNGAGEHLFAGRVGPGGGSTFRRAVLAFDIQDAVPAGATIEDVTLSLNMSRTLTTNATTISVHSLTSDWGEGESEAPGEEGTGTAAATNDATWIHTFYDTEMWDTEGGDFVEAASGAFDVGELGEYSVSDEGMIDDVQQWLDDPASNFGWILIGDEVTIASAIRFDSRENADAENHPRLTISYSTNVSAERPDLPSTLRLAGNYPNPVSNETTIRFDVDRAQSVSLVLYDMLGREVRTLLRSDLPAGSHEVDVSSDGLSAGTYLYCFDRASATCGQLTVMRP